MISINLINSINREILDTDNLFIFEKAIVYMTYNNNNSNPLKKFSQGRIDFIESITKTFNEEIEFLTLILIPLQERNLDIRKIIR